MSIIAFASLAINLISHAHWRPTNTPTHPPHSKHFLLLLCVPVFLFCHPSGASFWIDLTASVAVQHGDSFKVDLQLHWRRRTARLGKRLYVNAGIAVLLQHSPINSTWFHTLRQSASNDTAPLLYMQLWAKSFCKWCASTSTHATLTIGKINTFSKSIFSLSGSRKCFVLRVFVSWSTVLFAVTF